MNWFKKSLKHEDMKIGDHAWALQDGKLLVVMRIAQGYEVCGAWECGIGEQYVTLIERIKRPKNHKETELYYL